ncbi:hypothetical protein CVT24_008152 [Panaeolus cyanescens]|uniref:NCA2-domain-containing protein n=1 Tax=Panaeolus cyanescens TaxID=181874 RepID=A0A409VFD2_9AGAR|nr:hypothetical protein CVT24_008152 [Panaeolus cyanescens]
MPSEFVNHYTKILNLGRHNSASSSSSSSSSSQAGQISVVNHEKKIALHDLLFSIENTELNTGTIGGFINQLNELEESELRTTAQRDTEQAALEEAVVSKLTVALYRDALDLYLSQATQVEAAAEWWAEIENSTFGVLWYFLQTLPLRLYNVATTIARALHAQRLPLTLSNLSPRTLRTLFPSPSSATFRPHQLTVAFFPYLRAQESLTLAMLLPAVAPLTVQTRTRFGKRIVEYASLTMRFINLPLELTRQECRHNRLALEKIRDKRANVLGKLASLRPNLASISTIGSTSATKGLARRQEYTNFLQTLIGVISPGSSSSSITSDTPLTPLLTLTHYLPSHVNKHEYDMQNPVSLVPPSRLVQIWPQLVLLPPLAFYLLTTGAKENWVPRLLDVLKDGKETIRGFVSGWLIEPLMDVLKTVRGGRDEGVIVSQEGVAANLESLERMSISLARDRLNYTQEQLAQLAAQVKLGDLTPIMEVYEEDMKRPLVSAVKGELIRGVLLQVQKAKVDIDQALSGIDRLLKSQELTFAFVGVAPAFGVVYLSFNILGRLWTGGRGRGRWGGKQRRKAVWEGMRRIERLLIRSPSTPAARPSNAPADPDVAIAASPSSETGPGIGEGIAPVSLLAPLPTGLLILSLTRIRSYALQYLPNKIREPFLEDLGDLEDPSLGREDKLLVVQRMWRCWGSGGEGVLKL